VTPDSPLKVLVAVPDWQARLSLESAMKDAHVAVALATNSDEALRLAAAERPEFIVMDHRIPTMGALRLCAKLRSMAELEDSRIIVLGDGEDRASELAAMNAGADAYLSKLLDAKSLLERMVQLERQQRTPPDPTVLKAGAIEMVPEQWVVSVDRNPVHLTEIEYRLLQELLQVKGRVLTRETLMERVWGHTRSSKMETRTLDVHMSRLRGKLRNASESIITVRNVGYRIDVFPDWLNH
jgi:DNA-binding response OmpR family regulator